MDIEHLEFKRMRRLRSTESIRELNSETTLNPSDFVYPMFVLNGSNIRHPVASMPGVSQLSVDQAIEQAKIARDDGVKALLLFGLPDTKDATGSKSCDRSEAVQRACHELKKSVPEVTVITDVCLCEYTDHGHCGVLSESGDVDNDATLPLLAAAAVSHADAGADIVAPSAMMDGQVAAIRAALNESGHRSVPVMGYSAKYASVFYGPFRDAADSAPQFGDRRAYQMAPTQRREAMLEIQADVDEGADWIMVKPALAYLDVIHEASQKFTQPLAAYNVSGEYSMIKAAAANGWIDEKRAALEVLTAIKRAGADLVITYFAIDAARWISHSR